MMKKKMKPSQKLSYLALLFALLLKSILRQKKEELWKTQIFISPCKNYIIFRKIITLKSNQNPSRYIYYNSIITNLKFSTQAKIIIIFQKNPHLKINRPIIYYLGGKQNPLSYYTLYNESKHNVLALVGKANNKAPTNGGKERNKQTKREDPRSWSK